MLCSILYLAVAKRNDVLQQIVYANLMDYHALIYVVVSIARTKTTWKAMPNLPTNTTPIFETVLKCVYLEKCFLLRLLNIIFVFQFSISDPTAHLILDSEAFLKMAPPI